MAAKCANRLREFAEPDRRPPEPVGTGAASISRSRSEVDELLAVEGHKRAFLAARALGEIVSRRQSSEPYFEISDIEVRGSRHG